MLHHEPPVPIFTALSRDELKAIITEAIISAIPAIIAASQKPQEAVRRLDPEAFNDALIDMFRQFERRQSQSI